MGRVISDLGLRIWDFELGLEKPLPERAGKNYPRASVFDCSLPDLRFGAGFAQTNYG